MTARLIVVAVLVLGATPAIADSHKLLVLQSEGRVDAATRAKIDAAIVKLAAAAEPETSVGSLNFTDAATAVGCKPDAPACKDEVLGMLAVDEIVIASVARKPGGLELTVRRIARGGASREATMALATGAPLDKLDGLAPLFAPPAPPGRPAPASAPAIASVSPYAPPFAEPAAPPEAVVTPPPPVKVEPPPVKVEPSPVKAEPTTVRHEPPTVAATPLPAPLPPPEDRPHTGRRGLEIAGMAGGASMVVVGLLFWGAASGVQGDIDKSPTTTTQDLASLRELEDRGDRYAALGNLFAIGGLAVGGVATYFYVRDRRAGSTVSARITPAVLPHGAGLVLTIGGAP
jgi:hypothetical protein